METTFSIVQKHSRLTCWMLHLSQQTDLPFSQAVTITTEQTKIHFTAAEYVEKTTTYCVSCVVQSLKKRAKCYASMNAISFSRCLDRRSMYFSNVSNGIVSDSRCRRVVSCCMFAMAAGFEWLAKARRWTWHKFVVTGAKRSGVLYPMFRFL